MKYTTLGRYRRGGKNIAARLHTGRVPQPLTLRKDWRNEPPLKPYQLATTVVWKIIYNPHSRQSQLNWNEIISLCVKNFFQKNEHVYFYTLTWTKDYMEFFVDNIYSGILAWDWLKKKRIIEMILVNCCLYVER